MAETKQDVIDIKDCEFIIFQGFFTTFSNKKYILLHRIFTIPLLQRNHH